MRHLPNLICIARMALIWPIVASLYAGEYGLTLVLFTFAAISDGVDGYLAKRFGWQSDLGKVLDPAADKFLLVIVFVAATWLGLVPTWLTAAAVARDVLISTGAGVFRLWFGPLRGSPTVLSKINTLFQLSYLLSAIAHAGFGLPPREMLDAMAIVTLTTTVLSGASYMSAFGKRAWSMPARSS